MRTASATAVVALLLALTICVFLPTAQYEFSNFDDAGYVTRNRIVAGGVTFAGLRWALTTTAMANWHPLTWLSHMLDVELFGMDPGAHHAVSAGLHALNAALLFLALRAFTGAMWRSALVAALFAVHPLHVESVAFVAERKDVLSALFVLLALLAWAGHLRRPAEVRYAAACGLLALALLAKPMPVSVPFLLLLLDIWPLGRWVPAIAVSNGWTGAARGLLPPWALVREKLPLACLALGSSVVTVIAQYRGGAVAPAAVIGLPVRLENAFVATAQYLQATLWPAGLAVYYPHPLTVPWWGWSASLLVLGVLSLAALRTAHSRPWLLAGWLWFLGMLVPVIGLVQVGAQARADRYTYLPLVGIFLGVVWEGASRAQGRRGGRRGAAIASLALVAVLSLAARVQLGYWRDPETLFRRALAVTPDNPVASGQLGVALLHQKRYVEAEQLLRRAIAGQPANPITHNNLAIVLDRTGRREEAIREYEAAIARDPGYAEARLNLGTLRLREGRVGEALALYRDAVRVEPDLPVAHFNLATALETAGRWEEALPHYETALRGGTSPPVAHERIGVLLERQGRLAAAAGHLTEALRLDPQNAEAAAALRRLRKP